jgi:DNA-binding XRE family transcriptional regulator
MPAKPVFNDDQLDTIRMAARRVYKAKFEKEPAPQRKMALALGVSQQSISALLKGNYRPGVKVATEIAILDGHNDLEDLVGPFATPADRRAEVSGGHDGDPHGFKNLDVCIQFHAATKHWSPWTIAAARAGFFGQADFAPPEWSGKLDTLERVMEKARKM